MRLTRSRRSEECLSDLQLDALFAGEGGIEASLAAEAHAAVCARCLERWTNMRREREEFDASHARFRRAEAGAAPAATRRRFAWLGPGALVLAAAAALLLWIRRPVVEPDSPERMKGGSTFGFYVKHDESVVRGTDEQVVHPGDELRFVVHSPKKQVGILSIDGARNVTVYFPAEPRTASIDAVQEAPLDRSIRLDAVLGRETLHAIFCDAPTDLTSAQEGLRVRPSVIPSVPGCEVRTLTLEKKP